MREREGEGREGEEVGDEEDRGGGGRRGGGGGVVVERGQIGEGGMGVGVGIGYLEISEGLNCLGHHYLFISHRPD